MILNANHRICELQRLVHAEDFPSASIFRKGWQRAGEEGESNDSGLNSE